MGRTFMAVSRQKIIDLYFWAFLYGEGFYWRIFGLGGYISFFLYYSLGVFFVLAYLLFCATYI